MKIVKELLSYVVIIGIVVLIRIFIITPVRVNGPSMEPLLHNEDIILLKKFDQNIERFEVIVFEYAGTKLVKRVIGLPGEHIEYRKNQLYVNDILIEDPVEEVSTENFDLIDFGYETIPDGYYFVLGDNRDNSTDSRAIGLVSEEDIVGTTNFLIYPFSGFGVFH